MKQITIRDIAKEAGVSVSTVSLVINRKGSVSERTRKKVEKIIKTHNYHPSSYGKNLALKSNNLIGAVISDRHFYPEEKFYTTVYLSAIIEAQKEGKNLLLSIYHADELGNDNYTELPDFVKARSVDGVIVIGDIPDNYLRELLKKNIPTVMVNYFSTKFKRTPYITADNRWGAHLATQHFLSMGHKDIGFIAAMNEDPTIKERCRGFIETLEENSIPLKNELVFTHSGHNPYEYGFYVGEKIAKEKIKMTSVFAASDLMAIGLMRALQNFNIKIPDDIAIIGFDDITISSMVVPGLSTIRFPKKRMGERAVQKLAEMIRLQKFFPEKIILPVELIIRGSCGSKQATPESEALL